jgi:hypothetical protein
MRVCISCTRPRASAVGSYLVPPSDDDDDDDAVGDIIVDVVEVVEDLAMMTIKNKGVVFSRGRCSRELFYQTPSILMHSLDFGFSLGHESRETARSCLWVSIYDMYLSI